MARIVMADDGIAFDGIVMRERPLGGAETAFASLAEAFAARGHAVTVANNCPNPGTHFGVAWAPIKNGLPDRADLYIANRGDRLLLAMNRRAGRTVFWIHNPARYLLKLRYLWKLALLRPAIVFSGPSHLASYPAWAPCGARVVIPYGIGELFRRAEPVGAPPSPRAIFTSNPLRGLAWLLELWAARIHPGMPTAELHVFSGPATYGAAGDARRATMMAVLDRARTLSNYGVVLREPVAKSVLVDELRQARVLLYRGDPGETFCLAVGEAQAVGVPAVVQPIAATPERVIDGVTGYITGDDNEFANAAVRLMADDALWLAQHRAALDRQRGWGWADAAASFERLIP
ncbi:MAG: glycosyltransferase family 4 protein [Alphaproteobacteria bacterium]|nr:glycosyltransferase family 4 protein [Alphaproteobacteria bacterium]